MVLKSSRQIFIKLFLHDDQVRIFLSHLRKLRYLVQLSSEKNRVNFKLTADHSFNTFPDSQRKVHLNLKVVTEFMHNSLILFVWKEFRLLMKSDDHFNKRI